MPDLMNKAQLADAAKILASSYDLVQRNATTFIPVHWETGIVDPPPQVGERIWVPFTREDKLRLSNKQTNILFANDGEFRSFDFMIRQVARYHSDPVKSILIKTPHGLKMLNELGELVDHDGQFTPNYVQPTLNEDEAIKAEVFAILVEWLGGDSEEATSLLHHLATCLAPGYSAVKYILLLGEGRNGKSVFLTMISELFGQENVSNITRQMMAERSPTCVELNDKLVNVIFDGEMTYIKDSSMEKTLIAGERGTVRMLYESGTTPVQTNALFIEALNREPKARDKSSALQKRLVRFRFPNVYPVDKMFFRKMTSEKYLGALLSLLIDHYVREDEIAEKLKLTQGALDLQLEQVYLGSPVLQFLENLNNIDSSKRAKLMKGDMPVEVFLNSFKPWCETQKIDDRTDAELVEMLKASFEIGWKTKRIDGKPKNVRMIKGLRPETLLALEQLKGGDSGDTDSNEELVGD